MVLVLHILGHGGVLDSVRPNSAQYHMLWFLEVGAYCAVDTFAMVSGYLMINNRFKASRILGMWVQVLFYGLLFNAIFEAVTMQTLGIKQWIKSLVPVYSRMWWYFSAYFALSFFIPFINKALHALTKRQTRILLGVIFALFCVIGSVGDGFGLNAGYSTLWLAAMYIVGAAVQKAYILPDLKKRWAVLLYVIGLLLTWGSRPVIAFVSNRLLGREYAVDLLINYLSPLTVLMSLALLLFFRNLKFAPKVCKILKWASSLSFAVYIIHEHPAVKQWLMTGKFVWLASIPAYQTVGVILAAASGIFIGCILLEALRVQLFKVTRLTKLLNKIGSAIDKKLKLDL